MKVASWNVNSLRVRLPQVLEWAASSEPDILGLQETKLVDADFPGGEIESAGYHAVFAGQKTYNGVAILSRKPAVDVVAALPEFDDDQRRVIAATIGELRFINLYVPNGEAVDSPKYQYKLDWLSGLKRFLEAEQKRHDNIIVVGDFNIAPDDRDVYDPDAWRGSVLASEPERAALRAVLDTGFVDTFRLFGQAPATFSWWDYRMAAFRRNLGLRIDLVLANNTMASRCTASAIDKTPRGWERPSDHAPVVAQFRSR